MVVFEGNMRAVCFSTRSQHTSVHAFRHGCVPHAAEPQPPRGWGRGGRKLHRWPSRLKQRRRGRKYSVPPFFLSFLSRAFLTQRERERVCHPATPSNSSPRTANPPISSRHSVITGWSPGKRLLSVRLLRDEFLREAD